MTRYKDCAQGEREQAPSRIREACESGSLGSLNKEPDARRRARASVGGCYVATCGGCALALHLEPAAARGEACRRLRDELGWRERQIPGVRGWRWFCPRCQWDMDLTAMFYFSSPYASERSYNDKMAEWVGGNPYISPPPENHTAAPGLQEEL